jgi:hypothetical protein
MPPTDGEHLAPDGPCLLGRHNLLDSPFGILQARLGRLKLIGVHEQYCVVHTQAWVCAYQYLGQGIQPLEYRVELTLECNWEHDWFDQAGRELDIGNGQCVLHRFGGQRVLLIPGTGTPMQYGYHCRLSLLQMASQHLGKQVVVAVPAPLLVEGDHKQVRPLERFQHGWLPS